MARVSGKADKDRQLLLLGNAIRARREALEVSQEALADAALMDRAHIGKIERGERNVALRNIERIAATLEMTLSDLLDDV